MTDCTIESHLVRPVTLQKGQSMRFYITESDGLKATRKVADSKVSQFIADMLRRKIRIVREVKPPSIATMGKWLDDGVAKCPDGCRTECDGKCEHGLESWLIILEIM